MPRLPRMAGKGQVSPSDVIRFVIPCPKNGEADAYPAPDNIHTPDAKRVAKHPAKGGGKLQIAPRWGKRADSSEGVCCCLGTSTILREGQLSRTRAPSRSRAKQRSSRRHLHPEDGRHRPLQERTRRHSQEPLTRSCKNLHRLRSRHSSRQRLQRMILRSLADLSTSVRHDANHSLSLGLERQPRL